MTDPPFDEEEGWETWARERTPVEEDMCEMLEDVSVGDTIHLRPLEMIRDEVEVYFDKTYPGYREMRARPDPHDGGQPPFIIYIVRDKFVYLFTEHDGEMLPVLLGWPWERAEDPLLTVEKS